MKPDSFTEWLRMAGPAGPMLWAFDHLVHFLAGFPDAAENHLPVERDENAVGFGLIVWVSVMLTIVALILLIKFFPH